jgi:transposase
MKEYSKYVGLDVHAETISLAVADAGRGEVRALGTIANNSMALRRALRRIGKPEHMLVCYEAGPCGYNVYWDVIGLGADCEVIAPTLIPTRTGDRVKTDRRDAMKLARLLRSGELVAAWVPNRAHEALRNLVRARLSATKDERRAKNRLTKFLLRMGKQQAKKTKPFGQIHCKWLSGLASEFEHESDRVAFEEYHGEWAHQRERVLRLDQRLTEAIERLPETQRQVFAALCALRGVAKISAITVLAEVGSFSRFDSPRQLMSYAGIVPSEHSSGGSTKRGGITKTGNAFLRRSLAESAWSHRFRCAPTGQVQTRRRDVSAAIVAIAERADKRLNARYRRLIAAGKPSQKAITAVARELLGFMWAAAIEAERAATQAAQAQAA